MSGPSVLSMQGGRGARALYSATGFSGANFFATSSAGGGEGGSSGLWGLSLLAKIPASGALCVVCGRGNWDLRLTSGGLWQFVGPGATVTGTGLVSGKWQKIDVLYDGTNLKMYQGGVQTASTPATYAAGVTVQTFLGKRNDGFEVPAASRIAGMLTWSGAAPSPSQVAAHFASCVAGNDMLPMPGVTNSHRWSVQNNRASMTVLSDLVGADPLNVNGALSVVAESSPPWV